MNRFQKIATKIVVYDYINNRLEGSIQQNIRFLCRISLEQEWTIKDMIDYKNFNKSKYE